MASATRDRRAAAGTRARPPGAGARSTGPRRREIEIIDAAARVFARRGYHGTTTTDIADELGMRQASLYYYFPSKEAALEAVVERGVEGFVAAARAIQGSKTPTREKLKALISAHISPITDRHDYVRVFLKERHNLPHGSRRRIGRQSRTVERIFESVIAEGIRDGSFAKSTDARLATLAVLGMCNSVHEWWQREGRAIGEVAAAYADIATFGIASAASGDELRRNSSLR